MGEFPNFPSTGHSLAELIRHPPRLHAHQFSPLNPTASHCRTTSTRSTLPDHSFPLSTLSSPQSQTIRSTETSSAPSTALGRWWTRRGRQGWLRECRVGLSSVLREGEGVGRGVEGWRFVRLRAERGMNGVGWGVYELKVEVKK